MRLFVILLTVLVYSKTSFSAPGNSKFSFDNAEMTDVLKAYSNWTGQKFIWDANVRGKISIINANDVTPEDAFAMMSTSLAMNGYAIVENEGVMRIDLARNVPKWGAETLTELPPAKPEKMVTYIHTLKHVDSDTLVNRVLRPLASRDGMMFPASKRQILIADWVSNIHRLKKAIDIMDKPNAQFKVHTPTAKAKTSTEE